MADTITIADLTLEPYAYREREDPKYGLEVELRARLSPADEKRLLQLLETGDYYPVKLPSGNMRQLRLGTPNWSAEPQGAKYDLLLIEEKGDLVRKGPQYLYSTDHIAAYHAVLWEKVLGLLVSKGVVTEEEIADARAAADTGRRSHVHKLFQVDDIDATPLPE